MPLHSTIPITKRFFFSSNSKSRCLRKIFPHDPIPTSRLSLRKQLVKLPGSETRTVKSISSGTPCEWCIRKFLRFSQAGFTFIYIRPSVTASANICQGRFNRQSGLALGASRFYDSTYRFPDTPRSTLMQ